MPSGWRAILQIDTPRQSECLRFGDVGVVDPIHITIFAEDPFAATAASRLYARLQSLLQALVRPAGQSVHRCGTARGLGCMARGEPSCRSVLVALTGTSRISRSFEHLMHDWTRRRLRNSTVLPILPAGAQVPNVLPKPFDQLTVLFDGGAIEQLAPDVLRAAHVGGREHRLFLSYRRDDVQELAEQLHDELTHAGFHVFLDRFRGVPGTAFPPQLRRELADKGVVLVIESPNIAQSSWTLAEVSFARALRLGLLALHTPGAPKFAAVAATDRIAPSSGWTADGTTKRPMLDRPTLRQVVDDIRQRFAAHALYRQLYLENLLHAALGPHRLTAAAEGGGAFSIATQKQQYVVQLSPRLPEVAELRRAVTKARASSACAVLLGASRLLAPEDAEDLQWTADQLACALRSEGRLRRLAKSFSEGKVPPP